MLCLVVLKELQWQYKSLDLETREKDQPDMLQLILIRKIFLNVFLTIFLDIKHTVQLGTARKGWKNCRGFNLMKPHCTTRSYVFLFKWQRSDKLLLMKKDGKPLMKPQSYL
jgi:hypothetical protein